MKMPPQSWSSLNNYLQCPFQYHAMRVEKRFKQEETEHTRWGNDVHKALEEHVKEGKPLPERMKAFEEYAATLALVGESEVYVELKLAVNYDLHPVDFFANDVWMRCVVDYLRIKKPKALSLDHKSGKRREGSRQLKMSAGIVLANFPEVEEIVNGYAWLQEGGAISTERYTRAQIPSIWNSFREDLEKMQWSFQNNVWPKQESGLCKRWCPVLDCLHNGRGNK